MVLDFPEAFSSSVSWVQEYQYQYLLLSKYYLKFSGNNRTDFFHFMLVIGGKDEFHNENKGKVIRD